MSSIDEQIKSTQAAVIHLEKQLMDPQVYVIKKRNISLRLKELKIELRGMEDQKRTIEKLEELKQHG